MRSTYLTVIQREIIIKLNNKSFYLLSIFSPILFLIPILFSLFTSSPNSSSLMKNEIGVLVSDSLLFNTSTNSRGVFFKPLLTSEVIFNDVGAPIPSDDIIGIIDLRGVSSFESMPAYIKFYCDSTKIKSKEEALRISEYWINQIRLNSIVSKLNLSSDTHKKITRETEIVSIYASATEKYNKSVTASIAAYILGMLIYITFVMYNNNILRSVTEEKNSKLIEVMSIYVDPKQLVVGKILGMGIASLIQMFFWIISFCVYLILIIWYDSHYIGHFNAEISPIEVLCTTLGINTLKTLGFPFPLFFILGLLFNGACFTIIAILSGKKNSKFLQPLGNLITILIIYFGMYVATNPSSNISCVLTYLPFSSYISVPILSIYGLSSKEIIFSLFILFVSTYLILRLSMRIYKHSLRS